MKKQTNRGLNKLKKAKATQFERLGLVNTISILRGLDCTIQCSPVLVERRKKREYF